MSEILTTSGDSEPLPSFSADGISSWLPSPFSVGCDSYAVDCADIGLVLIVTLLVGDNMDCCKAVEDDEIGGGVRKRGSRGGSDEWAVSSVSDAFAIVPRPSLVAGRSLSGELSSLGRLRSCSASSDSPAEVLRSLAEFSDGNGAILILVTVYTSHGDVNIFG